MQLALNESKSNNVPKFNVKKNMDPWTELKHYPVIKVTQEQTNVSNDINIIIFLENVNAIDKMVGIPLPFFLFLGYSHLNNISRWLFPEFVISDNIHHFNNGTFAITNTLQAGEYQLSSLCL